MIEKRVKSAWRANLFGLVVGAIAIPFLYKRPVVEGVALQWFIIAAIGSILCCIPAIVHFKNRIVASHDFSDGGVGLIQPMKAWSTIAFLPFCVGVFHYVKTGTVLLYLASVIASCVLIAFFKPVPKNA